MWIWNCNHAHVLKIEKYRINVFKIREKVFWQSGWNGLTSLLGRHILGKFRRQLERVSVVGDGHLLGGLLVVGEVQGGKLNRLEAFFCTKVGSSIVWKINMHASCTLHCMCCHALYNAWMHECMYVQCMNALHYAMYCTELGARPKNATCSPCCSVYLTGCVHPVAHPFNFLSIQSY